MSAPERSPSLEPTTELLYIALPRSVTDVAGPLRLLHFIDPISGETYLSI